MISRKALSPVIATVILSGVVLAVGGAVWAYTAGASTVIADGYINDTLELVEEINERFIVEHVTYESSNNTIFVWVFNHGEMKVIVDTYLTLDGDHIANTIGKTIPSYESKRIAITIASPTLAADDIVAIKVHSRRQNNAYYQYIV